MTATDNRAVVELFLAGTHSGDLRDLAIIDGTVASTIRCHGFPGSDPTDRESYKAFFRTFQSSFTDMNFTVLALVADENFVSARFRVEVSHTGDFAGVRADGRRVSFEGMALYRIENGLIAETWLHLDQLSLLGQIGAIKAAA